MFLTSIFLICLVLFLFESTRFIGMAGLIFILLIYPMASIWLAWWLFGAWIKKYLFRR
jgi:hypothetical protein